MPKLMLVRQAAMVATLFIAAVATAAAAPVPARALAAAARSGDPQLAGVWEMDRATYRSSSRFSARERIGRDINGQLPPLQPWAAELLEKRVKEADDDNKIFANNAARCLPQGIPYMLFAAVDGPIQILETPGQITILSTEMAEQWLIYMNTPHREVLDANYHGDSVGRWEGDTLVVDTVGVSGDKTTVDQVGTPHTDDLHVTTRIRRINATDMEVRVLLEDTKAFTRSWERRVVYHRSPPGTRIDEYVCENTANAPDASGFQGFRAPQ